LNFYLLPIKLKDKKIIDLASEEQMKAFREITLNIYMGHIVISGYYRKKLIKYKNLVHSLCDREVSSSHIKELLHKHSQVIPLILKPYFRDDGGGISTREKDDLRSDEGETE
jgi:hypothetical protein